MKHVWKFRDNLYHFDVVLFVGSDKQLIAWMKRKGYPLPEIEHQWSGFANTLVAKGGRGNVALIWLEHLDRGWASMGVLQHECFHLAKQVLDLVGVTDDNEALAYLQQYYFCSLCDVGFDDWPSP